MDANWTKKDLPENLVNKVNKTLGFEGKPYLILSTPSVEKNWTPDSISTGCFCWRMEVHSPVPEEYPSTEEYLEHVM